MEQSKPARSNAGKKSARPSPPPPPEPEGPSAEAYAELLRERESLIWQVEEFRRDTDQFRRDNDQLRREKASWESQLILLSGVDAINNVLQNGFERLITQLQPLGSFSSGEKDLDTATAQRFAAIRESLERVKPDSYRFVRNDADVGYLNDAEPFGPPAPPPAPVPVPTYPPSPTGS